MGGGAEVHLHEIFTRIAKKGHNVTLFCSNFPGGKEKTEIDGIKIIRKGTRNTFNFTLYKNLKKIFNIDDYDIIIDDINKIPFYTPLLIRNKPVLAIVHHLFKKTIFLQASIPAASYVYISEKLIGVIYKNIPFAVVSESTKEDLIREGIKESDIFIVYNSVDHKTYKPDTSKKADYPLISYLGRIKKYKSVDHIIRAVNLVKREIPEIKLKIVGDGDDIESLKKLAISLNLKDNIEFTGFVFIIDSKSFL